MRRAVSIVMLTFVLLLTFSVGGAFIDFYPFMPNIVLPVVICLGVAADIELVVGALLSFILGYLFDVFGGGPMGVHTLVFTAMFLLVRGAGFSFASRGFVFQIFLSLLIGLIANATVFALRAIFEKSTPIDRWVIVVQTILLPSVTTALVAPFVIFLVGRTEVFASRRRREGALR